MFEAPHRLKQTLEDVSEAFSERRIAVCRELTKTFEEVFRGTAAEALAHFHQPRGEFTIVIEGANNKPFVSDKDIQRHLKEAKDSGLLARDAVKAVTAATGRPHREVYALWLELSKEA